MEVESYAELEDYCPSDREVDHGRPSYALHTPPEQHANTRRGPQQARRPARPGSGAERLVGRQRTANALDTASGPVRPLRSYEACSVSPRP
jgi:hypothetical protein